MRPHLPLRRFSSDQSGNFATLSALFAPVAITLAAFAVDEGALYVERRQAQAITDLAAIAAAADLSNAEAVARATFTANSLMTSTVTEETGETQDGEQAGSAPVLKVLLGQYSPDPSIEVSARFMPDKKPYNAVQVTFEKTGNTYFSKAFFAPPRISASAVASATPQAAFSVGSRLLRLDGGVLNGILGALTGSELSLSLMDYEALIDTDADLLTYFGVLATEVGLDAATYEDVLDANVTIGQLAGAMAGMEELDRKAREAAGRLERSLVNGGPHLKLGQLIDLGAVGPLAVGAKVTDLSLRADLMEVLTTAAVVANGENQVAVDLGATLPGLLGVTLDLAIGEPPQHSPWFAVGTGGEIVRTAQTRLRLVVEVGGPKGKILGLVALPSIKLPLYLDVAFAEAKLADISCPTGRPESIKVGIDARPGVADLRITDLDARYLDNFRNPPPFTPAKLVHVTGVVTVTGAARVEVANSRPSRLNFNATDIRNLTVKQTSTTEIVGSLTGSLLDDLKLDVRVDLLGLNLGLPGLVGDAVSATLRPVAPTVDTLLVNLLSALGMTIGEADVRVHGASCGQSVLVQ